MSYAQLIPKTIYSYLALGDSYTIGESVSEADRFPVQLTAKLNEKGHNISKTKIIAKTGWTTDELLNAIENEKIAGQTFDIISLLVGVNNQYRGRDIELYRHEFVRLLEIAIQLAGNNKENVFVVSIPDWGVTPFGKKSDKKNISAQIDLFNTVCREETLKKGILYVDITPISRRASTDLSLIANDGLHPSGKMYGEWVEKILEVWGRW